MDFFQRQDRARHQTKRLLAFFALGVLLLILSVYLAVGVIFGALNSRSHRFSSYGYQTPRAALWNPELFAGVSVVTLSIVGIGALFKTAELSKGGSAVATLLGGAPLDLHTTKPEERRLLNIVEEMAIASGIPMPTVYVLRNEHGINAFAAGHSSSDAVVAVTNGALKLLTRDELQGVIGHEFSHILNGDMRLNLRLIGVVFGIVCLAVIGRVLLRMRSRGNRNPLPLLGLALLVIGSVGVFFGRLIQAAVSRQREYLADAAAVQFTRNPLGLAGALKKIGGLAAGSALGASHAEEASHLFFSDGMRPRLFDMLATHPPLTERIKALDPAFDGNFPHVSPTPASVLEISESLVSRSGGRWPPAPAIEAATDVSLHVPPVIAAQAIVANTGSPGAAQLRYAEALRREAPESLKRLAREPYGATTIIYSLLLSGERNTRDQQLAQLTQLISADVAKATATLLPEIEPVATRARLPLVEICLPALRQLAPTQFFQFRTAVERLVECDNEIDLFEYMLQRTVLRHLTPNFEPPARKPIQFYALRPLMPDCGVLLSAVAYVGQSTPAEIQNAFSRGATSLGYVAQAGCTLSPEEHCQLEHVDRALERLSLAVPQIKKNVLSACVLTVAADGWVQEREAELLRAIADSLDCPLPPFVPEEAAVPFVN